MKTTYPVILLSLLICLTFNLPHSILAQGSLEPPGAPAPMFRTLQEVQPRIPIGTNTTPGTSNALFVISQSGSYHLTTNITGVAGKHGIFVAVAGVTLDLMGFEVAGVSNALNGIMTSQNLSNIVIRNGTVRNWQRGVDAFEVNNGQYEDLRISGNSSYGLRSGVFSAVGNCVAQGNFVGISARGGTLLTRCTAANNGHEGIVCDVGVTVIGCSARYNGTEGIFVSDRSVVNNCSADGNFSAGIQAQSDCTITFCSSGANTLNGITADTSSICGCTVNGNGNYGISVTGASRVVDNTCVNNGSESSSGSGILISNANGSRIENNHVVNSRFAGIYVLDVGNLIIRNSASGNGTNYVIVAGNKVGPIVAAPSSGAISGSTGGAGVGTTDPWANFSY
jgi:parallel beta-helix repeat protein